MFVSVLCYFRLVDGGRKPVENECTFRRHSFQTLTVYILLSIYLCSRCTIQVLRVVRSPASSFVSRNRAPIHLFIAVRIDNYYFPRSKSQNGTETVRSAVSHSAFTFENKRDENQISIVVRPRCRCRCSSKCSAYFFFSQILFPFN